MRKTLVALIAIVIIGAGLRFYGLGSNPPGLTWDEASLGYNAYSILKTGADEYGHKLPLTLQSFGDYKPALYAYFTIPSVFIFGLTEFAVRLPSALFGTAAIVLMFLLVRRLFENEVIGVIAAFVLAFSPWHIHYSRGGWEANVALTIILFGVWCFIKGLENAKWLIGCAILFPISLYTYQGSRLFVPLLGIGLVVIYWNKLSHNQGIGDLVLEKAQVFAIILGCVLLIPFLLTLASPVAKNRLKVQSMFSYSRPAKETALLAKEDGVSSDSVTIALFHSQTELWGRAILERQLTYLSPSYLFVTGDHNPRQGTPGVAEGYWVDIPFYLLGLYVLVKKPWKHKSLFILWLLLAPLPATLSRDSFTSLRSLPLVFAVDTMIALGIWWFLCFAKAKRMLAAVVILCGFFFLYNVLFFLDAQFVHLPKREERYWLSHYKKVIELIKDDYPHYDQVLFTTDYNEPYIFLLFYLKIDPAQFQKQAALTATRGVDVGEIEHFNQINFRHIYWPHDRSLSKTLFVGTDEELPEKDLLTEPRARLLDTIKFGDGSTAFKIVETK